MQPKLSILIPTLESRRGFYNRLMTQLIFLIRQCPTPKNYETMSIEYGNLVKREVFGWDRSIEILTYEDRAEQTIGYKRNELVQAANGIAMSFIDCDDFVGDQYIQRGLEFADSGKDVASLIGLYFLNGVYDRPFVHSDQYTHWYTEPTRYIRNNNHLNFIKTEIARQIKYPEQSFGEDGQYSEKLKASGLIKTEFEIKEVLYFYFARSKKEGE